MKAIGFSMILVWHKDCSFNLSIFPADNKRFAQVEVTEWFLLRTHIWSEDMPVLFRYFVLILIGLQVFAMSAHAGKDTYIPEPLKPWKKWVLEGLPDQSCPFLGAATLKNGDSLQRICAWPSTLNLKATSQGASFEQTWILYEDGIIPLPGDKLNWPVSVEVDRKSYPVIDHQGNPALSLKLGKYKIQGLFQWQRLPNWLSLSSATGLVNLNVDGKPIPFPQFNGQKIGLGLKQKNADPSSPATLNIKVYRNIIDDIPLTIDTKIILDVSGPGREVLLGKSLLDGAIPLSVKSPIPARLESNGQLRLQVKPGHWTIDIASRQPGPVLQIESVDPGGLWAKEEIWSYQSNTTLRLVELSGLPTIDPQQTGVPEVWKHLPAYRAEVGEVLTLKEKMRGNSDPEKNSLALQREFWLDFNGEGYTIKDRINGALNNGWRLNASPDIALGRVSINGKDQLVTYSQDNATGGVEIRQGGVNLTAVSRVDEGVNEFNATGWQHDFNSLRATLYLPPGYRLLAATGMDRASPTWISRWSLFDFFMLLIITASISNLKGRKLGAIAFITLGLVYHESNAPVYVWLSIAASLALLNVLPGGRFRSMVTWYRNLSYFSLIVIALPFMIDQARQSIYPQLEHRRSWVSPNYSKPAGSPPAKTGSLIESDEEEFKRKGRQNKQEQPRSSGLLSSKNKLYSYNEPSRRIRMVDPDAKVQTGPGLPAWKWNRVTLTWNGPVSQGETVKLFLIPPWVNSTLGFMRIFLILILAIGLVSFRETFRDDFKLNLPKGATAVLFFLTISVALIQPGKSFADIPSPDLLKELKQRLLEPPECGQNCFDIQRTHVEVRKNTLSLRMEIHATEDLAVPLPGTREHWLPGTVTVNGKTAQELYRHPNQSGAWLHLSKGIHQVILTGPLPKTDQVQVYFPRKPHQLTAHLVGWEIEGVQKNKMLSDSLQLTRKQEQKNTRELRSEEAPAFVRVNRRVRLGFDWEVQTTVTRIAPETGSLNLKVPLLPGESVLSEHVKLNQSNVIISLGAGQQEIRWMSTLKQVDQITLTANKNSHWVEQWTLDVSPMFHVAYEGLPSIIQQTQGYRNPEFRPWPGETLNLSISRPQGIEGSTLAVDHAEMFVIPGKRVTQSELKVWFRSSKGGQHTITLPENAELESIYIAGKTQPIRQEGREVPLPIKPGTRSYTLKFKTAEGIDTRIKTPDVHLNVPAANTHLKIRMPSSRWVLFASGPSMGPAILFWGELLVVILLALVLGRMKGTPLKTQHWILLGLAMSTITIPGFLIVVVWLFALAKRKSLETENWERWRFNLLQFGLGVLTFAALVSLFSIIPSGLLGSPDMHIVGNQSSAHMLNWYQDRIEGAFPTAGVISVPLIIYRLAILFWALWMAFALIKWLKWGWTCYSVEGLWRKKTKIVAPKPTPTPKPRDVWDK